MIEDKITKLLDELGVQVPNSDKFDTDSIKYVHEVGGKDFQLYYKSQEGEIEYSCNERLMLPLAFGEEANKRVDVKKSVEVIRINLKGDDKTSYSGFIVLSSDNPEQIYASIRTETYDTHIFKDGNKTYFPSPNKSIKPLENHPDVPINKFNELYQKMHVDDYKVKNQERIDKHKD